MADNEIPIHPVPTNIGVAQVETEPGQPNMVVMMVTTPLGTSHYFMPGDAAEQIGHVLVNVGKQAQSGLVLPPPNGKLF